MLKVPVINKSIYKCEQAEFTLVDELDKTERGEGGYGHTGVRN